MKNSIPKLGSAKQLKGLREIGWNSWDPIGLSDDREDCEDEYDTYLIRAAGMIWNNIPFEDVVEYLLDIERNYIGMGDRDSTEAQNTVSKLEEYIDNLRA